MVITIRIVGGVGVAYLAMSFNPCPLGKFDKILSLRCIYSDSHNDPDTYIFVRYLQFSREKNNAETKNKHFPI